MSPSLSASARDQRHQFEAKRKLEMVIEWLEMQSRMRMQACTFGRMQVELLWENGTIKSVKVLDETVIKDLTDKEREHLLGQIATKTA